MLPAGEGTGSRDVIRTTVSLFPAMEGDKMDQQNTPQQEQDIDIKPPRGIAMKIVVLLLILLGIGGSVAAWFFLLYTPEQKRKAELAVHTDFWNEFTKYQAEGYGSTWSCIFGGTAESQVNTNLKLEQIIDAALSQNEAMFGKLILACIDRDEGLLEAVGKEPPASMVSMGTHSENLRNMKVPEAYKEKFEGMPEALDEVHEAWKTLGEYFQDAEERAKWDAKLTEAADNGWGQLYAQKKPTATHLSNAWRYYKFMTCSLGKDYSELGDFSGNKQLEDLVFKIAIDGECSTDEKAAAYFPTIDGCAKKFLLAGKADLEDPSFQNAVQKKYYNEARSLAAIAGSWQDPETGAEYQGCIRRARAHIKATGIAHLFSSSAAYAQARIELSRIYKEEKAKFDK